MNSFIFFGEALDESGLLVGRGPVMTFTEGVLTCNIEWGATKAETLEQILAEKKSVLDDIRHTKKMALIISNLAHIHNFNFAEKKEIPRFTLNILDAGQVKGSIFFQNLFVDKILPINFRDRVMPGHGDKPIQYSKASYSEIYITVRGSITT